MLKIAPSDSLVHKLTSFSDLNDWLVLDDEVCKPSTSSYCINLSNSLNNNVCIVFLWYGKMIISNNNNNNNNNNKNNNNNNNNNNMAFKKRNPQNMPY